MDGLRTLTGAMALLWVAALTTALYAETVEKSTAVLDTVVVQAASYEDLSWHEKSASSVEEIDGASIPKRIFSVEDLLDTLVGVDVDSTGGMGARKVISIRGSTSKQIKVYVDGVPVTASASGVSGLASIPMGIIQKIQVFRGSSPGYFGSGAIGGVINIITFPDREGNHVEASASYGSFETNHQQISGRYGLKEKGGILLSAGHRASKNNFRYLEDRGTKRSDDDTWKRRENSDYESNECLAGLTYRLDDTQTLKSKFSWSKSDQGIPGSGTNLNAHTRLSRENMLWQGIYDRPQGLSLMAWGDTTRRVYDDPEGEGRSKVRQKTTSDIDTLGIIPRITVFQGAHTFFITSELKEEKFKSKEAYGEVKRQLPSTRTHLGAGLEAEIAALDETLWFQPRIHWVYAQDELQETSIRGTQRDRLKRNHSIGTWAAGVRYHLSDTWVTRVNAGIYNRLPQFDELFGDTGDIASNASLKAERSTNLDTGIHYSPAALPLEFDLSLFYRFVKNKILLRNYGDHSVYENIGAAEIYGMECLSTGSFFKERLVCRASLTLQDALNKSDATQLRKDRYYNKQLPYHPNLELSTSATVNISPEIGVSCLISHESQSYRAPSNLESQEIAAKTQVDLSVSYRPLERVEFTLDAKNIGDEQAEDRWGYPIPGRAYYITMKYRFE